MAVEKVEINKIIFGIFNASDIYNLSVVEIKTSICFNALDHPLKDGLYDLVMGPSGMLKESCLTCRQTIRNCCGHFGHINLPLPVINPLFHKEVLTLLKLSCSYCYKLAIPPNLRNLFIYQMKLLDHGKMAEAEDLETKALNLKEMDSNDAQNYVVKENYSEYLKELELDSNPVNIPSSRSIESLRLKFLNEFIKQIILPKSCTHCKNPFKRIIKFQNKIISSITKVEIAKKFKDVPQNAFNKGSKQETTFITPKESRETLRKIWEESKDLVEELMPILKNSNLSYPTDLFFMDVILVTPPKARPVEFANGIMIENPHTVIYKNIINDCIIIKNLVKAVDTGDYNSFPPEYKVYIDGIRGATVLEKLHECWLQLQNDIDTLLDSSAARISLKKGISGLKQVLEKKEGVLRMHMMGKRVNFAARTVITPDPNLNIQEIGVPEYFAKKLTYPVGVNFFNVEELRKMVQNGPDVYPGATLIENENGSLIKLTGGEENRKKRIGISKLLLKSIEGDPTSFKTKKVHRHLLNGDIVLLNRQPTLHRPSIMAHIVKILKNEKTFRLHYSNCKAYNADFDGDEMNLHLPQTELSRSEGYNIVNVANHYLVPKDGTPLGGLIQDHIVSTVRLTMKNQMFEKEDYHQLVYQGLSHKNGNIILLPPCIVKPKKLWSGKQIISTILINIIPKDKDLISFNGNAKISVKLWETGSPRKWMCGEEFKSDNEMSESSIILRKGILVTGVLDKQHFGATPFGLTHCLYELYGGECSSKFLNSIGRLSTAFLQMTGFTLGVEDILVKAKADKSRKKIIEKLRKCGDEIAAKALGLEEIPNDLYERLEREYFKNRTMFKGKLDQEYKVKLNSFTNEINKVCLPKGLISRFPENNLQLMVTSGAKGSTVNTMQISCLLGQIELEGKRPPFMISGKSLPSYKAFDTQPCAGGYIDNRFMTGISPQEFFFHCMAGREGLIDTAVKTSRSGYLQRCLIKHLEGVSIGYDGTVRDHDGTVIQFIYGGDGLEVQKSTFFKPTHMEFLHNNLNAVVKKSVIESLKADVPYKKIEAYREEVMAGITLSKKVLAPFTSFSQSIKNDIRNKYFTKLDKRTGRTKAYSKMLKKWNALADEDKQLYKQEVRLDPVTSKYNRNHDFGVITEKLETLIKDYLDAKCSNQSKKEKKKVKNMVEAKYMLSLCQPGEPVGLLAAQSIGEPSTQMTLNTFHFAGRGEMNVTLGIPRLREILMTASKSIKTPYVDVPLKKKSEKKMLKNGNKLKKIFQRVTLADVLETITVHEKVIFKPSPLFTYTIRFKFLPHSFYKDDYLIKPKDVLEYVEKPFLILLCKEIRKLSKKFGDIIFESKEEKMISKEDEEKDDADNVDSAGVNFNKYRGFGENHESSDEEEELDDDDATKEKVRNRHCENQEYDEPEESEEEKSDEENDTLYQDEPSEYEEEMERRVELGEEESESRDIPEINLTSEELKNVENRKNFVLNTFPMIKKYDFDVVKEEWCEMVVGIPLTLNKIDFSTILKMICGKSVLYQIPNVRRAFVYKNPSGELHLKTEGVNFNEMFKFYKMIDINRLYSNDVNKVVETLGIEAGVRIIVKELNDVFGVYGITVDHRHLLLVADYMTNQGNYSPFNRIGLADSSSPLQQMSFERSTGFLKKSLVRNQEDFMNSPSARIMAGRFCKSGTGCFDVMTLPSI